MFKLLTVHAALALTFLFSQSSTARPVLLFSYWTDATEPFVFLDAHGQITHGILYDLGQALASRGGYAIQFVSMPVKRMEAGLLSGAVHIDCLTSPIWKKTPAKYHWSPVLFRGADRLLVRKGALTDIRVWSDLKGKRVGVYNGYTYHATLTKLFESGEATAEQVAGIDTGVRLVEMGRIDALIDFGVLLRYQIAKSALGDSLQLATLHVDNFSLSCAYSPKLPVRAEELDQHFRRMLREGQIDRILNLSMMGVVSNAPKE